MLAALATVSREEVALQFFVRAFHMYMSSECICSTTLASHHISLSVKRSRPKPFDPFYHTLGMLAVIAGDREVSILSVVCTSSASTT
jgi:hypothetical protein